MNHATLNDNKRIDDKPIKTANCRERMNGIAFLLKKAQYIMLMTDEQMADLLMVNKEEIESVHYLEDSEIETDLLFRLYYAAELFGGKKYLDKGERNNMNRLKKACYKEISGRNNWL